MKKQRIVGIFAHPDDEAFGPAGTLAIYAESADVSIICVTQGNAGKTTGIKNAHDLRATRAEELRNSATILGASQVYFLDYEDGSLCNNRYHDVVRDLERLLDQIEPECIITYEPRGISGHLDHVAVSLISHYVYQKKPYVRRILSYILPREITDHMRNYFIYVPHGIDRAHADRIVDVSDVWNLKKEAILKHKSQHADVSRMLSQMDAMPKEEWFLELKKDG